ncbi:hypothetical protein K435DRAFT_842656 [Dendrothele bispora CBS 962.96]|uniref:Uncharacterized protein n=1 Tax=Dendrothele bispora (strain CBS 962.96) TaxID=1314807 RepID=A0A4V4HDI6_DENBC|nr:hypothetical protein K435DRAFT_842656 [Dendrothele bispora CBS 962.96]
MANRYPGHSPRYMNDFSKALAVEVSILLEEMGKLRDERRQLQIEIAELLAMKAKHGNGREYASPTWAGPGAVTEAPPAPSPPPAPPTDPTGPAKPGWRVVHKRPERKPRDRSAPAGASSPPPLAALPAPAPVAPGGLPAWAQWRPNPMFTPPVMTPAPAPVLDSFSERPLSRPGLFGK